MILTCEDAPQARARKRTQRSLKKFYFSRVSTHTSLKHIRHNSLKQFCILVLDLGHRLAIDTDTFSQAWNAWATTTMMINVRSSLIPRRFKKSSLHNMSIMPRAKCTRRHLAEIATDVLPLHGQLYHDWRALVTLYNKLVVLVYSFSQLRAFKAECIITVAHFCHRPLNKLSLGRYQDGCWGAPSRFRGNLSIFNVSFCCLFSPSWTSWRPCRFQ